MRVLPAVQRQRVPLTCLLMAISPLSVAAPATNPAAAELVLPPLIPWHGKSREVVVAKDDPWITPAEATDFRFSPSYDDTAAWLKKLCDASPQTLKMIS